MTLVTVTLHNESDFAFVFVNPKGNYWENLPAQGTYIQPSKDTGSMFRISTPGLFDTSHRGWLYFRFEIPGIGPKMFLIFTQLSNSMSSDTFGAGPCVNSDVGTPDEPFPEGQFGMTTFGEPSNVAHVTIFNKDLLSTELSPESWMGDLVRLRPSVLDWTLPRFKYPGGHDAGSFGNKEQSDFRTAWSWQCNDKNFYQQARSGVRWFDLRLNKRGSYYWPYHGYAEKTGDPLSWGTGDPSFSARPEDTLIGQMLHFIKEHPSEILIVHINFRRKSPVDDGWAAISKYLKDSLMPPPPNNMTPTLRSMLDQNRRIVIFSDHRRLNPEKEPGIMDYIWNTQDRDLWRGTVWNQSDWDKDDMSLVVKATETWMSKHIEPMGPPIFWWAQCQLTPSFMHQDFFLYPSRSPKTLAKDANPYTRQYITNRDMYKQSGSILSLDWASDDENIAIAAMNLDTDGSTGPWDGPGTLAALPKNFRAKTAAFRASSQSSETISQSARRKATHSLAFRNRSARFFKSPRKMVDEEYDEIDAIKNTKKSVGCCW